MGTPSTGKVVRGAASEAGGVGSVGWGKVSNLSSAGPCAGRL